MPLDILFFFQIQIRDTNKKQRSLVIPDHIIEIAHAVYANFKTTITTEDNVTPLIEAEKWLLQADCPRPILFNGCVNSFISTVQTKELDQISYMNQVSYGHRAIGFNLLMMPSHSQQWSQKIKFLSMLPEDGVIGKRWKMDQTSISHLRMVFRRVH